MFPETGTCSATSPSSWNAPQRGFGVHQLDVSLITPRHGTKVEGAARTFPTWSLCFGDWENVPKEQSAVPGRHM